MPQITIVLVGYYFLAHAFSVDVPFWECLVVMPLVLFISNLPIAFGGFGTTTLAWQEFFGQYGAADSIAALTLFIPAGRLLLRGLIGLISLPAAYHEVTTMSLLSGEQVAQDEE